MKHKCCYHHNAGRDQCSLKATRVLEWSGTRLKMCQKHYEEFFAMKKRIDAKNRR